MEQGETKMSSHYSRLIIESFESSFNAYIDNEDHCGIDEDYLKSLFNDWLNNELKRMKK